MIKRIILKTFPDSRLNIHMITFWITIGFWALLCVGASVFYLVHS